MTRKLASIQRISKIRPHPNADRLEIAEILGWKVIVQKGLYSEGETVVYFETDSVLPDEPVFADIKKRSSRVKAIRLRGEISEGLCMPLSILDGRKYENDTRENPEYDFSLGSEVTGLIRVTKWEPEIPAQLAGDVLGPFPSFTPKTDETRIQSVPEVLTRSEYNGLVLVATEKLDGTSMTIFNWEGRRGVCGRNFEFKPTTQNTLNAVAREGGLLDRIPLGFAVQGELIGPGIQGNHYALKKHEFRCFNVFDIDEHQHLGPVEMTKFCVEHDIMVVPQRPVREATLPETVEDLVTLASTLKSKLNPEIPAEGLVFRPFAPRRDYDLGRFSFKVISPEYLIKYGKDK